MNDTRQTPALDQLLPVLHDVTGLGPRRYCADRFNIFDGIVTVVGVVDMAVSLSPAAANNSGATVFRAFRLMRIFRLVRSTAYTYIVAAHCRQCIIYTI